MSWSDHLAAADDAAASYFDETECVLQPRANGQSVNHPGRPDPAREPFSFLGTIDLEPPADRIPRHMSVDTGVRSGAISYDAVLSAFVAAWPYRPSRDDWVVAAGKTWRIAASEDDGSGRPAYYLNKA